MCLQKLSKSTLTFFDDEQFYPDKVESIHCN